MTATALTYSRNSSKKQKSINDQAAENRAVVEREGWTLADELSDPSSASRYARKIRDNWARVLEALPSIDVIVLWEPSRGDRDLEAWAGFLNRCRRHGVRIHAVSHNRTYDPANPRDYRSLAEDGVDSAYESDKTSIRVRRGKATAAALGRPAGPATFGLERVYDMRTSPPEYLRQVEDPERGLVVRGIFEALAGGTALSTVVTGLNRRKVATARGAAVWHHGVVRAIATNPVYRPHPEDPEHGCRMHDGVAHVGTWPPLVDERGWQAVQKILAVNDGTARKARKVSSPGAAKYLLSGSARVFTASCGSAMKGRPSRSGRQSAYTCRADMCTSCPMPEADEYVSRLVVARLSRPDARDLWLADDTGTRAAGEELARLRAELEEARESFAVPGGISAKALAMKEQGMAPAIADAERRAKRHGVPLAMLTLIDAATFGADKVRPAWDGLALPARRDVIAGMFARLVLNPLTDRITHWTSAEQRLDIVGARVEHVWRSY